MLPHHSPRGRTYLSFADPGSRGILISRQADRVIAPQRLALSQRRRSNVVAHARDDGVD